MAPIWSRTGSTRGRAALAPALDHTGKAILHVLLGHMDVGVGLELLGKGSAQGCVHWNLALYIFTGSREDIGGILRVTQVLKSGRRQRHTTT